jgi:aspartate 1-decarboxylase
MMVQMLKSKIYNARITDCSIRYSGSFGIDEGIMKQAGILAYEKVLVINMNSGSRFETYCIPQPEGSGKFTLYGGAARLGMEGDPVIIMSFASMSIDAASGYKPVIVNL